MSENETRTCAACGCVDETLYEIDGKTYCLDCLHDMGYDLCDECGEVEYAYNIECISDEGINLCSSCREAGNYFYCVDCGEWYSDDNHAGETVDGDDLCERCAERHYIICEHCGRYVYYEDSYELDDEYYCRDCYDELERSKPDIIHQYGYKPTPVAKSRKHCDCGKDCDEIEDLLMGVELEVDGGSYDDRDDAARAVGEASEDVYMKSDGSLNTGFEIVTHPCTLDYHMYEMSWRGICSAAISHGFKSHDARTCGLHVHVGKYQLGSSDTERNIVIGKIVMLVYRHWDFMVTFSRRHADQLHWATKPEMPFSLYGSEADISRSVRNNNDGSRYKAVNLCNYHTIEFRLFNGTLKRNTIIATLQLVQNICKYAMSHTMKEVLDSEWKEVACYVKYPELTSYLAERNAVSFIANTIRADVYDSADTQEIKVGDRVKIVHLCSGAEGLENYIGSEATVATIDEGMPLAYGLDLGFCATPLHNLNGFLDSCSGYYVSRSCITLA